MDFADYGDFATFLHIRDTSPRFSEIAFTEEKKEEQTSETVREIAISNWSALFGAPEIMAAGKDSRFIGEVFQEFCTSHSIISQAVIPGHHQSLGAAERRHGLLRTIIDHMIGNR